MALFTKSKKNAGWLAISFHSDGICAAHISRSPAALPTVEFALFYPTEQSTRIAQLEKLAKELHASRYHCSALLAPGEYQILVVDAPNVPPEELKTAIRWRLKDMLDIHIDDATIDVLDIPVEKNAPVRNHSMYAVAAKNQIIQERQTLFVDAKTPLSAIDIPEMAQRNISVLMEPEGRGLAMLSFDTDGGLLTVSFAGELYLARRIDVTLPQIEQADSDQKIALFERITLELQRSLDHFDRQFHFITLSKLVVSPLGEAGGGLPEYLAGNLYVPVETMNLDTVFDLAKVPDLKEIDQQRRYFQTLGAALRLEEKAL